MHAFTILWRGEQYFFRHVLTVEASGTFLLVRHVDYFDHEHVHISTFPWPVELRSVR